jgi:hypothetical protein
MERDYCKFLVLSVPAYKLIVLRAFNRIITNSLPELKFFRIGYQINLYFK